MKSMMLECLFSGFLEVDLGWSNYFFKYNHYGGGTPMQSDILFLSSGSVSSIWAVCILFSLEFMMMFYFLVCFSDLILGILALFSFIMTILMVSEGV